MIYVGQQNLPEHGALVLIQFKQNTLDNISMLCLPLWK